MVRVAIIRHGETEWNVAGRYQGQSDVPLSPLGREQARKLAANFPLAHIDAVYASDLARAMETAAAVADKFSLPVSPEPAFRELDFGEWEGLTYGEIMKKSPDEAQNFFQRPEVLQIPAGETFLQAATRAKARLSEIIDGWENQAGGEKAIAVVAHGAVIRSLLAELLHIPMHYVWSLRQDNTAVNVLRFADGYVMVELLNSVAHLGGKLSSGAVKGQSPI